MSIRVSVREHNPFKVGDKVKVKKSSFDFEPSLWDAYRGYKYSVVTKVNDIQIVTSEDPSPTHYQHFELYEEEKDMTPQTTQQAQQKTNRVPFTHELWEKWKDKGGKVIYVPTGKQVMQLAYFPEADHRYRYVCLTTLGSCTHATDTEYLALEIPVTTKRIPFNPELKDAKVFTTDGNQSVVDWVMFKDGQVACQWHNQYMSYYPTNYLEMEIEEDV